METSKLSKFFTLCQLCQKPYQQNTTPSKCSRCKLLICSRCSSASSTKPLSSYCSPCNEDLLYTEKLKIEYQLSWNHTSPLALKWMKSCNVRQELNPNGQEDYRSYISQFNNHKKFKGIAEEITNDMIQGRQNSESFNHSLSQFLVSLRHDQDKPEIRANVENVLKAYYARHSDQGYNPLLIAPVVLLLCFADEETTFWLLSFLAEKLMPRDFWNSDSDIIPYSGLLRLEYVIYKAVLNGDTVNMKNHKGFQVLYNKIVHVLLGGLTVDMMNVSTTVSTWDEMFTQRSFRVMESNIMKIITFSWQRFESKAYTTSLLEYRLFTSRLILPSILNKIDNIELNSEDEQIFIEEFEENVLDQVILAKKELTDTIDSFKDINENEIKLISAKLKELTLPVTIITPLGEHVQKENVEMVQEGTFVSAFIETPSLKYLGEKGLAEIFQALDIYREGMIHEQIVMAILVLCAPSDLEVRIGRFFDLFDSMNEGSLSYSIAVNAVQVLHRVLCILSEACSGYVNFHQHVCEMSRRLKKRLKKEEKVSKELFQRLAAKYSALQVLPGITSKNIRHGGSTDSFISIDDQEISLDQEIIEGIELLSPEVISDGSRSSPDITSAKKIKHLETPVVAKLHIERDKSGEDGCYVIDNMSLESPGKSSGRDGVQDFEILKEEEGKVGSAKKDLDSAEVIDSKSSGANSARSREMLKEETVNCQIEVLNAETEEISQLREEELKQEEDNQAEEAVTSSATTTGVVEEPPIVEKESHNVGVGVEVKTVDEVLPEADVKGGSSSGPASEPDAENASEQAATREGIISPKVAAMNAREGAEIKNEMTFELDRENREGATVLNNILENDGGRDNSQRIGRTCGSVESDMKASRSTCVELRDDSEEPVWNIDQITNRNVIRSEIKEKAATNYYAPQKREKRRTKNEDTCVLCNIF